jgi:hypothetical protein
VSEQAPHDPWNTTAETVSMHSGGVPAQPAPADGTLIEFGPTDAATAPAAPRKRRRGLVLAATTAAVVLVGAGAYAGVRAWTGAGNTEPESVTPASVTAFARVDLNPGVRDKLAFDKLVKKFPTNGKSATDVLTAFETKVAESAGLDYDTDVKPWFDGRVGFGFWTDKSGQQVGIITLASKDDSKAKATLAKVQQKQGTAHLGYTLRGGYALLTVADTDAQADATAAAAEAAAHPLSGNAAYRAATGQIGDDNLLVAYVDLHGIAKLASGALGGGMTADPPPLGTLPGGPSLGMFGLGNPSAALDKLNGTVAIGGRIVDDGLEIQAHSDVTGLATPGATTARTSVRPALDALPGNSIVALATTGADPNSPALAQLQPMLSGILGGALGGSADNPQAAAMMQQVSGILTKIVTAKVLSVALTGIAPTPSIVLNLQAQSAADAAAIVTPIKEMFGPRLPGALTLTQDGDTVHATYGQPGTGQLSASPVYAKAMVGMGDGQFAAFVDIQALLAAVGPNALPPSSAAAFAPVKGVGISSTSTGTTGDVLIRIIVTK